MTILNPLDSVDKRDVMRDIGEIVVALHKKLEVIFTGLSFSGIAKMQWYL